MLLFSSKRTKERNSSLSRHLAQLHSYLAADQQNILQASCKGALASNPPTVAMPRFANDIIELCRQHAPDDDRGLDMEVAFREFFAEVLECPVDAVRFVCLDGDRTHVHALSAKM